VLLVIGVVGCWVYFVFLFGMVQERCGLQG